MPPLPDRVRHEFAALALGYYASGRLAVRADSGALAAAHILHHAVEFVLKASLARHTTLSEMKKFGHRLPDLFASAESRSAELRNDEHRATAALLHELWESRFPDRILDERVTLPIEEMLDLARVDRLFCAGFRAAGLNPVVFMERFGPEAIDAVRDGNPEKAFFG